MTIRRFEPGPRMSQAVIHKDTVYLAGQVGAPGEDVTAQTKTILSATIWLADIADFGAMNAVWDTWVDPSNPPARATGGNIALATPDYRVEIIVVAAI